jgi:hypothetical protein
MWEVNTGRKLFLQSRKGRSFPANSILIGFQSTNGRSRCLGIGFRFPASRYPRKACFRRTQFPLVPGRPMGFRVVWVPDSCSRIEKPQESLFPTNSISIGSRSTNGVWRCLGLGFMFPASRNPKKACFRRSRFPLVPGRPMGLGGVWVSDSCSPHRETPRKLVSDELDFHWFSVDQWIFELFGCRIRVPRTEKPPESLFPANSISIGSSSTNGFRGKRTSDSSSPHRTTPRTNVTPRNEYPCRQCSFDPVTDKQTNKQTNLFNFVRPSFQSRELVSFPAILFWSGDRQTHRQTYLIL